MSHNLEDTVRWVPQEKHPKGFNRRAWLTVITGTEAGRVYPLSTGTYIIGRGSEADIRLIDGQISREHTRIVVREDGTATIQDNMSKNGTMLGSRSLLDTPCALRDGAMLQIGGAIVMRFSFRDRMEEHFERNLYHSATRDGLTGAFNKHHFNTCLDREFSHSQRYGQPISVVLMDLDDFKSVNDRHGHPAGDHVLTEIAGRVSEELRGDEVFARYGGEEFVVLLRKADIREGLHVAERLRRVIENAVVTWCDQAIPVTVSLGVASTSLGTAASSEELFQDADDCLYRAKRNGKNRVCGPSSSSR